MKKQQRKKQDYVNSDAYEYARSFLAKENEVLDAYASGHKGKWLTLVLHGMRFSVLNKSHWDSKHA